jgi:hypothetical protein
MIHEILTWTGWNWITIGACAVGWVAALLFVIRYQIESRGAWRTNPFGRFLMTRKILLVCLFSLIISNRLLPGWEWRIPITAVLMCAFAVQTFVPYRLLVEAQQERAHNEEARQ